MSVMIQIRNVPDEVHRTLEARAALDGMTLSGYLLRELQDLSRFLTKAEVLERLARLSPVDVEVDVAALIREDRSSHGSSWTPRRRSRSCSAP